MRLKATLETNGWVSRNAGWHEFELSNNWSELILEGNDAEILLHGAVTFDNDNVKILDKIFTSLNAEFMYEYYGDNRKLLMENKAIWQMGIPSNARG